MKKIAILISELNFAGAQIMIYELLKKIHSKYTIKVFVKNKELHNDLENKIRELNIEIVYIGDSSDCGKFKKILNFIKLKKEINLFKPDLIHCHLVEKFAFLYSLIYRKQIVFTIHSWPDRIITRNNNKILILKLLKKHQIYFVGCAKCVSNRFDEIINNKEIGYNYIRTIYNPIDLSKFTNFNKLNKINNQSFTFVNVGRLSPIKNQKLLIDSFYQIQKEYNCKLIIIGNGELKNKLNELIENYKLKEKVELKGNLSNEEVNKMVFNSDCFVLTSDSECCPMVILEALALRVPIISTDVGGVSEITNKNCILINKGDEEELVKSMKKIINNKTIYNEMAQKGFETIKQFDSEKIAQEYCKLYNEIIN